LASKDTYLGLTFKPVLPADMVVRRQWLLTGFATQKNGSGMKGFNNAWFGFKKGYRDRFLYKRMISRASNDVQSEATGMRIDRARVNAYYGNTGTIVKAIITLPYIDDLVSHNMYVRYPTIFNGTKVMTNATNPDKVITYTLMKSCYGKIECKKKTPGMGIKITNPSHFSYTLKKTVITKTHTTDSNGNTTTTSTTKSSKVNHLGNQNHFFSNRNTHPTVIIWYRVGKRVQVDMVLQQNAPAGFVITFKTQMVPAVPVQIWGKRAPIGSKKEKYREWFMERLGLELRGNKNKDPDAEGIYDILDKIDKDNDGGAHTQKQVDTAHIIFAIQPKDPYVLPECDKWVKTDVAQNYPHSVLMHAKPNSTNPKNVTSYYVACGKPPFLNGTKFTGSAQWWREKNRLRRKKFAKFFFELVEFYGDASVSMPTDGMSNIVNIDKEEHTKSGTFATLNGSQSYLGYASMTMQKAKSSSSKPSHKAFGFGPKSSTWLILRKQISATSYTEITIKDIIQKIDFKGENFTLHLDGSWTSSADEKSDDQKGLKIYPQLWVPFKMYELLDFTTAIVVKEHSIKFSFFTSVTIETSWIWVIILFVVTLIVCLVPALMGFCPSMLGITIGMATATVVLYVVIYVLVIVAIQIVVMEIAKSIDDPWLKAAFLIIVQVVMAMVGNYNGALTNPNFFLPLAAGITTIVYNTYVQIEIKKQLEQKKIDSENEAIENKIEMAEEGSGLASVGMQLDTSSHYSHTNASSPDVEYGRMDQMFNYDQFYDVSGAIDYRINSVPG